MYCKIMFTTAIISLNSQIVSNQNRAVLAPGSVGWSVDLYNKRSLGRFWSGHIPQFQLRFSVGASLGSNG